MNIRQKRILFLVAVLIVSIFILSWLFRYLTTGVITVETASSGYYVRVLDATNGREVGQAKPINKSLDVRLKAGQYQVFVYAQAVSVSKNVDLKARQHKSISITPPKLLAVEPVNGQGVLSLAANGSQTIFVNQDGFLTSVNPDGTVRIIDNQNSFTRAQWSNPDFGVAQSANKNLYLVKGGVVGELALPFNPLDGKDTNFAVSPNSTIYVSHGNDLYKGAGGANFTKIYSDKYDHLRLAASDTNVAVFYTGTEGQEGVAGSSVTPTMALLNSSGQVVASKKNVSATGASWSPDSKAVLVKGQSGILLFGTSMKQVLTIPVSNLGGFAWKDNNTFLYGNGTDLWSYDINTANSHKVAILPSGMVDGLYINNPLSSVYLSVAPSDAVNGKTRSLTRVDLAGQSVPNYLSSLNIFLPEKIGVCSLNYINFSSPIITVSYPATTTTADFCINAAKGELKYYNVDSGKFTYQTNPGHINE